MYARALLALGILACVSPAQADVPVLTVVSYNVNYERAGDVETIRAIAGCDADVVFLQETNRRWERSIRRQLKRRFPHMDFRHYRRAGGLAVLSRYPLRSTRYIDPDKGGWWQAGRHVVVTPIGDIQVLNLHLRPPLSAPGEPLGGFFATQTFRARELEWFLPHLDERLPTLVLGDLNEQAGPATDTLRRRGLRDAVLEHAPGCATWRWSRGDASVGQILDHVYYGPRLRAVSADVLEVGRSDHLPVRVVLQRR